MSKNEQDRQAALLKKLPMLNQQLYDKMNEEGGTKLVHESIYTPVID